MSLGDQLVGLNSWASQLARQTTTVIETGQRNTPEGKFLEHFERQVQIPVTTVEKCGSFQGMFEIEYPLNRYTFPDGRVFQEFVQAAPWSLDDAVLERVGGHCFFLALKDSEGKESPESLWSNEDIKSTTLNFYPAV